MIDGSENNRVEYNSMTAPPGDLLKIMILQRRNDALNAIEKYYELESMAGKSAPYHIMAARVRSLFIDLQAAIKVDLKQDDYDVLKKDLFNSKSDADKIVSSFYVINEWLYSKKLIQFDNLKGYDSSRVEKENRVKKV